MARFQRITVSGAVPTAIADRKTTGGGDKVKFRVPSTTTTSIYIAGNENIDQVDAGATALAASASGGWLIGPGTTFDTELGRNDGVFALSAISTISVVVEVWRTQNAGGI